MVKFGARATLCPSALMLQAAAPSPQVKTTFPVKVAPSTVHPPKVRVIVLLVQALNVEANEQRVASAEGRRVSAPRSSQLPRESGTRLARLRAAPKTGLAKA